MAIPRKEHIQWVKQRALEYVENDDIIAALGSFYSDMSKHAQTETHPGIMLAAALSASGNLSTKEQMKNFIEGIN